MLIPVLAMLDPLAIEELYVGVNDSNSGIDKTRLVVAQSFESCIKKIAAQLQQL